MKGVPAGPWNLWDAVILVLLIHLFFRLGEALGWAIQ